MQSKVIGTILGFAIGDALGVPYENSGREVLKRRPVTGMTGWGYWGQPAGTWSDDTSMVLCTMESLSRGYNIEDLARTFHGWLYEKRFTPHGVVFDIGDQTLMAIERIDSMIRDGEPIAPMHKSDVTVKDNGNGSLMRILPLAFILSQKPVEEHFSIVRDVSSLTHPHDRSVIACFIVVEYAIALILGMTKEDALKHIKEIIPVNIPRNVRKSEINLFTRILKEDICAISEDWILSKGYVISSLEAFLWCLLTSDSYKETVLKVVNLGGDADTNAALAGGLAGLVYGTQSIPEEWLKVLVKREVITEICKKFARYLRTD